MAKKKSKGGPGWHGESKRHALAASRGSAGGSGAGTTAPSGGAVTPKQVGNVKALQQRARDIYQAETGSRRLPKPKAAGMKQVSDPGNIRRMAPKVPHMPVPKVPNLGKVMQNIEKHKAGGK